MKHIVLIFDYDGTIHNTLGIYEPAFRYAYQCLVEEGLAKEQEISRKRIAGWLGLNSKEMWNDFMPELDQKYKDLSSKRVGDSMAERIRNHQAVWYKGAKEALDQLAEAGYTMVILSNCKISYREAHVEEFQTSRWFQKFYDCESYGFRPKTEIVEEVRKEYPGKCIVIGDRKHDLQCAKAISAPFIGCEYGFGEKGELEEADLLIGDVRELPEAVAALADRFS